MTSTAVVADRFFFNNELLATRDSNTANLSPSAWVANLEKGIHAAIHLAEDLKSQMASGAPSKDTMHSLYFRVLALSSAHENHRTLPSYASAISEPLNEARKVTEAWYLGCIDPEHSDTKRHQVCPTPHAVAELLSSLKSLVATDEDGNRAIDLAATAQPFINRYNGGCKPAQVFETPVELFEAGAPLAWMAGKK